LWLQRNGFHPQTTWSAAREFHVREQYQAIVDAAQGSAIAVPAEGCIRTVRKALVCRFVYAFVPPDTIENVIMTQAQKSAKDRGYSRQAHGA